MAGKLTATRLTRGARPAFGQVFRACSTHGLDSPSTIPGKGKVKVMALSQKNIFLRENTFLIFEILALTKIFFCERENMF